MARQIDNFLDAWTVAYDDAIANGKRADEAIAVADALVADQRPELDEFGQEPSMFGGLSGGL